ncbi:hypothetical protein B0T18DRAFT_391301 [Schizothecium vesticola]|uniref:Uncharacterized protein n=1 Tax=Schizothecium vesticola TaxID=314040 RepID=A0AA40EWZ5_9PEZI|nr:hypothetical protein B0T18DRAFT_391301 [Schizothecium vesticola]
MDIPALVAEMTSTLSAIQSTLAALASAAPDHDQKLDELELRRDTTVRALLAAYAAESESLAHRRRQERDAIAARRRREDEERERRRREEDEALAERERRQDEEREGRLRERTRGLEKEIEELMQEVEAGARRGAEEAVGRLKGLEGRRKELNQMLEEQLKMPPPLPVWETRPRRARGEVLPRALDLESIKGMGALPILSPGREAALSSPRGMVVPTIEEPVAATQDARAMSDGQEEQSPVIPLYRVASRGDATFQQHDVGEKHDRLRMDSQDSGLRIEIERKVSIQVTDMSTYEDEDMIIAEGPRTTIEAAKVPHTRQDSDTDSVSPEPSAANNRHASPKPSASPAPPTDEPSDHESSDLEYLPGAVQLGGGSNAETKVPVEPAPTPVSAAAAEATARRNYDFDDSSDDDDDDDEDSIDERHHYPVLETIHENSRVENRLPLPPHGVHGVKYGRDDPGAESDVQASRDHRDDQGAESPMMRASPLSVDAPVEEEGEFEREGGTVGEEEEVGKQEEKQEEQSTMFASPLPIQAPAGDHFARDGVVDSHGDVDEQKHQEQLEPGRSPVSRDFPAHLEDVAVPTSPNQDIEHPAAAERSSFPASTNDELHEDEPQEFGLGVQHHPVEDPTVATPAKSNSTDDSESSDDKREMPATEPEATSYFPKTKPHLDEHDAEPQESHTEAAETEATSYFPETKAHVDDHDAEIHEGHTDPASFTSPILNDLDQEAEVSEDERERVLEKLKAVALASKITTDIPDIGFGGLATSPRSARGSLAGCFDAFGRMEPVDEEYEDEDDLPVEETLSPKIKAVNFHGVDFGGHGAGPRSAVGSFVDPQSPVPAGEEFDGFDDDRDRPLGGLGGHKTVARSPRSQTVDIPDVELRGLTPSPRSSFAESRRLSEMGPADADSEGEEGEEEREDTRADDGKAASPSLSNIDFHDDHDEAERSVEVDDRSAVEPVAMSDNTSQDSDASDDEREVPTEELKETPLSPTHVEPSATHLFPADNADHREGSVNFGDPSPMTSLAVELGNWTMTNDDHAVDIRSPMVDISDDAQLGHASPTANPDLNIDAPTMHMSPVPEYLRDRSIDESLVKSIAESLEEVIRAKSPAVAADQTPSAEMQPYSIHGEHDSDDQTDDKHADTYAVDAETSWGKLSADESEVDDDKLSAGTPSVEDVLTPTPSLNDDHSADSHLSVDERVDPASHPSPNSSSDDESDADPYDNIQNNNSGDQGANFPAPEHDAPARPKLGPATVSAGGESQAFVTPLPTVDFRPGDIADKHRTPADGLESADEDEDDGDGEYFDRDYRDQDAHLSQDQKEEEHSLTAQAQDSYGMGMGAPDSAAEDHDVHETGEMEMAHSPAAADDSPSSSLKATTTSPKPDPQDTDDSELDYATPLPLDVTEAEVSDGDVPTSDSALPSPQTPSDQTYTPRDITNLPWNSHSHTHTHSTPPHSVTSTGSTISSALPSPSPSPHTEAHDPAIWQHHTPQSGPMMARSRGASVLTNPDPDHIEEKAPGAGAVGVSSLWPGGGVGRSDSAAVPAPATTSVFQRMRNVFEHGVAPIRTSIGGESGAGGSNRGSVVESSPLRGRGASGGGGGLFGGYTIDRWLAHASSLVSLVWQSMVSVIVVAHV